MKLLRERRWNEGKVVSSVEGLEALPGCPVGGECTGGQTLEDGILGVEVKVVEGCRHGKVVQENGGTGVGRGSASGAKRLNVWRERRERESAMVLW